MAQTGFTPIQLYSSSTPTNAPSAGNLTNDTKGSELAVNIADGKLFYKDTSNNVQTLADKTWIGTVTSVSGTSPVAVATGTSTPVVSLSAGYGDTQNPYASKTANNFLAAPNGSPGAPTFRAIVAADIPTLNQNTTGSAATLTTARNLWGQSFNGSADISAPLYPAAGTVSAPAYSVTSDTNTGIFFPAADTIAFAEGGAESMRIDSSGNLGLGTTPSPWGANWRGFEFGARGALSYNGGGGNSFLTLNAYSDGTNFIYKANAAATQYAQSAGAHLFSTAASGTAGNAITFNQAVAILNNGTVQTLSTISVGNATPSTSGAGITFPASQSASSNANTLDDYEEGTWTPVATSGAGSITAYTSSGAYTKVGNTLTVFGRINITNAGTASGNLNFSGLPFTSQNVASFIITVLSREDNVTGSNFTTVIRGNNTTGIILGANWTNNVLYLFSATYLVA
jgi:hypothetical protein